MMIYPVMIDGFEGQKIEMKVGGFKGPRLLINGEVVPKGKKRKMILRKNDGREVVATFKHNFLGLGIPNLIVDGEKIQIAEPLKWYAQVWCYMSSPLIL